jgi:serine phosphatase RsbU (regulator of sigma subunit)
VRYLGRGGDTAVGGNARTTVLAAISAGAERSAAGESVAESLQAVAEAALAATGADLAVVRVVEGGELSVRAVAGPPFLAAEIEGLTATDPAAAGDADDVPGLPADMRAAARRIGATAALARSVRRDGSVVASLELLRAAGDFGRDEREAAAAACAQVALVLRAFADGAPGAATPASLELAAEALAAGVDGSRAAERIAKLVVDAASAEACLLWSGPGDGLRLLARVGAVDAHAARLLADAASRSREPALARADGLTVASMPLGQLGVLQAAFATEAAPSEAELAALVAFAARAAQVLRAVERGEDVHRELDQTRDLLSVAGQATAELSLAHTLETVVDRLPDLLDVRAVGVYLRDGGRLDAAAAREVSGPHAVVAERLLELALGRFRARGLVGSVDTARDPRLESVRDAAVEAGIEAAHAVPLVAQGEVIGLLAVYPPRGRALSSDRSALLGSLAGQIAVAVQNARLHEETKQLGAEREEALAAERVAARRLSALYEISRSFAHSLSLERTLDAVAGTLVELLDVDAAVIRLPDERGEALVAQRIHVTRPELQAAVEAVFGSPEHVVPSAARRRLAAGLPVRLDAVAAAELGRGHDLLVPFLERGSTAAVVPIATPSELLATLTLVSLDPGRTIAEETLETALSVAAQAALAVDNARLYQQQKRFADSMQLSLLPRTRPRVAGLEIGAVYESSALLGVGGDVYDYLELDGERLAIVVGDVTGHGIDAAADMAMAKFVFRSLARLYPEPSAFLAAANDVVVEEIGTGKFITMLYLTIDPARNVVACASGGHPAPRLVRPDGAVERLDVQGLVLGIEARQPYEELRRPFSPGSAVVLFTDGVVEARRQGELFGEDRLDRVLGERHDLPAEALAESVLQECRRFVGGELRDDCAVVVVRRR